MSPCFRALQIDAFGRTALQYAARLGHAGVVRALLAVRGIGINVADLGGWTPLASAAHAGRLGCLELLLRKDGVDVNQGSVSGQTPLHRACRHGHAGCIRALLASEGIGVNHECKEGNTAISLAASYNHTECVRTLVGARGVDVNHRLPISHWTPLHRACSKKNAAMVSILLTGGGNRFAAGSKGEVPLSLAIVATAAGTKVRDKVVFSVFSSGVDYWQRRRHAGHAWAMRRVVRTLLLVRHRLGTAPAVRAAGALPGAVFPGLPHLPEEIWLAACSFLRGADFV